MRFSNKAVYALRALFDLAYHGGDGPVQLREIAEREDIPLRFLEQIFQELKKGSLVTSKRGPKGGYLLAHPPQDITVAGVLEVINELPELPELGEESASFVADAVCETLVARMRSVLGEVNLADMMDRGEELGVARECYERFVYVI